MNVCVSSRARALARSVPWVIITQNLLYRVVDSPGRRSPMRPYRADRRGPRGGRRTGRSFRPPAGPAVPSTAGRIDWYGRRRYSPGRNRRGTLRSTAPPRTRLRTERRATATVAARFELSAVTRLRSPPLPVSRGPRYRSRGKLYATQCHRFSYGQRTTNRGSLTVSTLRVRSARRRRPVAATRGAEARPNDAVSELREYGRNHAAVVRFPA